MRWLEFLDLELPCETFFEFLVIGFNKHTRFSGASEEKKETARNKAKFEEDGETT